MRILTSRRPILPTARPDPKDTVMVLHKLMLEPYLKRRFNEGRAQGLAQGRAEAERETDAKLQDWNNRRLDAEARGERFDEPLPVFTLPED